MEAEKIFIGKIYTANKKQETAEAMAVADGKIIAIGSKENVQTFAGPSTEFIQTDGLIIPGITEGHAHVTCSTEMIYGVALGLARKPEEYLARIRDYCDKNPGVAAIVGSGYDNGVFGEEGPTAALLDLVSKEIPIVMIASDHHSRWLNSKALELTKIDANTPNPTNGEIVRDKQGKATGWLKETAMAFANSAIPAMTGKEYARAILYYQQIALENGVTICFEPMFDSLRDYETRAEGYELLAEENQLKVTFRLAYSLEADDDLETAFTKMVNIRKKLSAYEKVQLNTAKFFVDGVVECHTAYLREEYADHKDDFGIPTYDQDSLNREMAKAYRNGFDLHTHVIGDAAADMAIKAYAYAQDDSPREDSRNALTHLQILQPDQMEQMRNLSVVAVTNPYWHYWNPIYYEELEKPFLGEERAAKEYPMRSLKEQGIWMSQASDFPVTIPPRTMDSLHLMVNRQEPGHPELPALGPMERLNIKDALDVMTIGGAYQNRLEKCKGSLEAGKDADFVILDKDVLTCKPTDIYLANVVQTYIEGKVAWTRK